MELIKSLNLMENKKLILRLNIASIPLTVLFFAFFAAIAFYTGASFSLDIAPLTFLLYFVAYFGLIIIHELIHGIFFKIFHKEGKVKFGFKNGLAYATSPHSFYTRTQFAWISLSPFLFITLALFAFYYSGWLSATAFIVVGSLHAASCIGDFYWVYLIIRAPRQCLVEDTEQGINFYRK